MFRRCLFAFTFCFQNFKFVRFSEPFNLSALHMLSKLLTCSDNELRGRLSKLIKVFCLPFSLSSVLAKNKIK